MLKNIDWKRPEHVAGKITKKDDGQKEIHERNATETMMSRVGHSFDRSARSWSLPKSHKVVKLVIAENSVGGTAVMEFPCISLHLDAIPDNRQKVVNL